jgi:hypothetical protein
MQRPRPGLDFGRPAAVSCRTRLVNQLIPVRNRPARGLLRGTFMKDVHRVIHRNGVVEFDDPQSGAHMVVMDGLTVESSQHVALAIVTVATAITCGVCFRRWIEPAENYRQGWGSCPHCKARLFLPPIYLPAAGEPRTVTRTRARATKRRAVNQ